MSGTDQPFFRVEGLTKWYGGVAAVEDVSLSVDRGQIIGLIGPNGAGKSTIVNLATGFVRPTSGQLLFKGQRLSSLSPDAICGLGIVRTFQLVQAFSGMSVIESVTVAALKRHRRVADARRAAADVLQLSGLAEKADIVTSELTIPDLKRLEIAKALATDPELLIADEAMAGLRPNETAQAIEMLRTLNRRGITLIVIEHVMRVIVALCERTIVLHHGRKIAEGAPREVLASDIVVEAYLGRGRAGARS